MNYTYKKFINELSDFVINSLPSKNISRRELREFIANGEGSEIIDEGIIGADEDALWAIIENFFDPFDLVDECSLDAYMDEDEFEEFELSDDVWGIIRSYIDYSEILTDHANYDEIIQEISLDVEAAISRKIRVIESRNRYRR